MCIYLHFINFSLSWRLAFDVNSASWCGKSFWKFAGIHIVFPKRSETFPIFTMFRGKISYTYVQIVGRSYSLKITFKLQDLRQHSRWNCSEVSKCWIWMPDHFSAIHFYNFGNIKSPFLIALTWYVTESSSFKRNTFFNQLHGICSCLRQFRPSPIIWNFTSVGNEIFTSVLRILIETMNLVTGIFHFPNWSIHILGLWLHI
jgi:hypothetical protein